VVIWVRGESKGRLVTGRWLTAIFHAWARTLVRVMGIELEVEGSPPAPPFFLVSNHLGYLDIVVLASQVRGVFLSKADVAHWPVVGTLTKAADTMFIDRQIKRDIPRAMRRIGEVLDSGRGVVVFPEGSSSGGDSVMRFHPSLLEAAASAEIPVSYAALSYRTPEGSAPAHLSVCWWGEMPFTSHLIELLGIPRIRAKLSFGEEPICERDRKVLARRLQFAVEERFQPVV
jgi:1-acyl-sn-glycerol-3-phosphate acyltransferase